MVASRSNEMVAVKILLHKPTHEHFLTRGEFDCDKRSRGGCFKMSSLHVQDVTAGRPVATEISYRR